MLYKLLTSLLLLSVLAFVFHLRSRGAGQVIQNVGVRLPALIFAVAIILVGITAGAPSSAVRRRSRVTIRELG
jgi:hypothetical protein